MNPSRLLFFRPVAKHSGGGSGFARAGAACLLLGVAACGAEDVVEAEVAAPLSGGGTTIVNRSSSAFENPASNLSDDELDAHLEGDVVFEATFVSAPAEVNPGLGPLFNNDSCAACHVRNGRGLPVAGQGPQGSQLLVRISAADGEPDAPGGPVSAGEFGTQLQDHATFGHQSEISVDIKWVEEQFTYPADGAPYALRHPVHTLTTTDGLELSAKFMVSARVPPPVFGLGLLEAVPEETLQGMADPDDLDGDGVSGRINPVWSDEHGKVMPGRFGWKSNVPTLIDQAAVAYVDDMGVTNPIFTESDGSTDIDQTTLLAAAFYTQTIAVPARANHDGEIVRQGEALFRSTGCAKCHAETLQTGDHEISALRDQTIHPYSDLLLHNMGFDLADGRPDFEASGTEWRTPPLWGIGVTETVLGAAAYLHDGRARTLAEAILWHGGEAESSKEVFRTLPSAKRKALLAFLRSL